jgi:hypothetical protein
MKIITSFYYILRSVPVVLFASSSTSLRSGQQSPIRLKAPQSEWSRLRMRTLRRDRSRCRGCDVKGDEITLRVHSIRSGMSHPDALLTLCIKCLDLATEKRLQGVTIPDFLRHLWRHLHSGERQANTKAPYSRIQSWDHRETNTPSIIPTSNRSSCNEVSFDGSRNASTVPSSLCLVGTEAQIR